MQLSIGSLTLTCVDERSEALEEPVKHFLVETWSLRFVSQSKVISIFPRSTTRILQILHEKKFNNFWLGEAISELRTNLKSLNIEDSKSVHGFRVASVVQKLWASTAHPLFYYFSRAKSCQEYQKILKRFKFMWKTHPQQRDSNPGPRSDRMMDRHTLKLRRPLDWVSPTGEAVESPNDRLHSWGRIKLDVVDGSGGRRVGQHIGDLELHVTDQPQDVGHLGLQRGLRTGWTKSFDHNSIARP